MICCALRRGARGREARISLAYEHRRRNERRIRGKWWRLNRGVAIAAWWMNQRRARRAARAGHLLRGRRGGRMAQRAREGEKHLSKRAYNGGDARRQSGGGASDNARRGWRGRKHIALQRARMRIKIGDQPGSAGGRKRRKEIMNESEKKAITQVMINNQAMACRALIMVNTNR